MVPHILLSIFLSATIAFAAALSPPSDYLVEGPELVPRKTAVTLMTWPVPDCSSNGIIETYLSDHCDRFAPRVRGLVIRSIASGCRVLAFRTATCSGTPTPLVVNRCHDASNYAAFMTLC